VDNVSIVFRAANVNHSCLFIVDFDLRVSTRLLNDSDHRVNVVVRNINKQVSCPISVMHDVCLWFIST